AEAGVPPQALAVHAKRRNHGQFGRRKLEGKTMFFGNCGITPAPRPVELGNHETLVFGAELVDTVLETVERQQTAVDGKARRLQCIENALRIEPRVGLRFNLRHWNPSPESAPRRRSGAK